MCWSGATVSALAAALENVIVNAIEHGGPEITVSGRAIGSRVRIEVRDSGSGARPDARRDSPAEILARLRGRSSHGHGLAVAIQTVVDHGGKFETDFNDGGSTVTIILPTGIRQGRAAPVRVNW